MHVSIQPFDAPKKLKWIKLSINVAACMCAVLREHVWFLQNQRCLKYNIPIKMPTKLFEIEMNGKTNKIMCDVTRDVKRT